MAKILIVDDAPFMRTTLKAILKKRGYDVVGEAENGAQGLELCQKLSPDLVILDVIMPGMNGLETLQKIMSECPTKVIMCTAKGEFAVECYQKGALSFVPKPFAEDSLIQAVEQTLNPPEPAQPASSSAMPTSTPPEYVLDLMDMMKQLLTEQTKTNALLEKWLAK